MTIDETRSSGSPYRKSIMGYDFRAAAEMSKERTRLQTALAVREAAAAKLTKKEEKYDFIDNNIDKPIIIVPLSLSIIITSYAYGSKKPLLGVLGILFPTALYMADLYMTKKKQVLFKERAPIQENIQKIRAAANDTNASLKSVKTECRERLLAMREERYKVLPQSIKDKMADKIPLSKVEKNAILSVSRNYNESCGGCLPRYRPRPSTNTF
ncbi:MAG: hypothetical protein WC612_08080 [Bdellovibrionales bacterium]